ncbi:hypothetical protein TKK_0000157 [Trichogramma kaykai]
MLNRIAEDDTFLDRVLFTDESAFGTDGTFNVHNHHQYSVENPHLIVENKHQTRFTINKWAGIIGDTIIGLVDFPEQLTGAYYRDFLENRLRDQGSRSTLSLTLDWCSTERQRSFISWPAPSPDLSPLDFFYWGAIKEKIYNSEIRSMEDLEERITQATAAVTGEMLPLVRQNFVKRLRKCIERQGGHFEQFM